MRRIKTDLQGAGVTLWTDEGIEPGTVSWKRSIEENIINAGCLIALLSPEARASKWVRAELDFAELHEKQIYLLLVRGDQRDSVPFGYATSQWLDLRNDVNYVTNIQKLMGALYNQFNLTPAVETMGIHLPKVGNILPMPFEWCLIPAGHVTLEDASAYAGTRGGVYEVDSFLMSRYPVTNAQYQVFLSQADPVWWHYSVEARRWREKNSAMKATAYPGAELPRTNVAWYDAMAFCRWLTATLQQGRSVPAGFQITLPTEQQWQRAAQGDDGRAYAWGDFFDSSLCNTQESDNDGPQPVTHYTNGASPYGALDINGNVWEWCATIWGTDRVTINGDYPRVLRGGSWLSLQHGAQVTTRFDFEPDYRGLNVGFRIAATI